MPLPGNASAPRIVSMGKYRITFLGTGTSIGIPAPGCDCRVCRSPDRRNRRSRCSVLIEGAGRKILIDTAPEFRLQALRAKIDHLDAVFWTHGHADHLHGLDDLRALTWKTPVNGYASAETAEEIRTRFDYLWKKTQKGGGKARINLQTVKPGERVLVGPAEAQNPSDHSDVGGILELIPLPVIHGKLPVFGWRCGPIAYITDASEIPESTYPLLEGVKILVLGALNFRNHPTHFNVQSALEEIKKIRPERAYLTHISHEASHRSIRWKTPGHVQPARDGLRVRTEE